MATKKSDASTKFNFADAIQTLSQLVERMESDKLTLEESLTLFEEGVQLTQQCQKKLTQATQRVEILMKDSTLQPFNDGVDN